MDNDAEKQEQQARLTRLVQETPNHVAEWGKGMGIGRLRSVDATMGDVVYAKPEEPSLPIGQERSPSL